MHSNYDLLIVGGGMVGASLACAVAETGLRIGLVEAHAFDSDGHPGYDARSLALAYGSRLIFEGLGLWQSMAEATPIRHIHISDRGRPGFARIEAKELGVDALGYVAQARLIGAALMTRLNALDGIDLLCPARLDSVRLNADSADITLYCDDHKREVTAKLLVAADGAQSQVRRQLGIGALRWDYDQSAIIANVSPERPHQNTAFERFTDNGPMALLPLDHDRCALICTVPSAATKDLLALTDEAFIAQLQQRFGDRLGRFLKVGRRQAYPLYMTKSREQIRPRVAIIGNAAQSLHPLAGQGFNLGLRDVAALAEILVDATKTGGDIGHPSVLNAYADWRRWDRRRTIAFTDGLARLFINPLAPLRIARNLGLIAFDMFAPAKRFLARQTMGLGGKLPRLTRGLPLVHRQPYIAKEQ